jgi:hypothetical protein
MRMWKMRPSRPGSYPEVARSRERYLIVQASRRDPHEATIIESFAAIEDAYEALDRLAERLHESRA